MRRVLAAHAKYGLVLFPLINAPMAVVFLSTRIGNSIIKWGDGVEASVTNQKNIDYSSVNPVRNVKNYSPPFTGDIEVLLKNGVKDVYSILLGGVIGDVHPNINIQDFEKFINQFPNLYSFRIDFYTYAQPANKIIKGDLATFPDTVQKIQINSLQIMNITTDLWLNISNIKSTSILKRFHCVSSIKVLGDLAKIPTSCEFFNCAIGFNSLISYSGGKTWASSFDTLYVPYFLTTIEIDTLLHDMRMSITSAKGGKQIFIRGSRTPASDSDVAYLESLGFSAPKRYSYSGTNTFRYIRDYLNSSLTRNHNWWMEIMVMSGATNIALGKSVGIYNTVTNVLLTTTSAITDGNTGTAYYNEGDYYALLDLGADVPVTSLKLYHYPDGRQYNNRVEVSKDGITWYLINDYNITGWYPETGAGKTYTQF